MAILIVAVAFDSMGWPLGSVQILVLAVYSPASAPNFLCGPPGVIESIQAFVSSGDGCSEAGLSCENTCPADQPSPKTATADNSTLRVLMESSSFRFLCSIRSASPEI